MYTVNLTKEQIDLIYDLVGTKFNEVATAWLPAEETKEMNQLSYDTLLNLRTVIEGKRYDDNYQKWNKLMWDMNKAEYLKEVALVDDSQLIQQNIK